MDAIVLSTHTKREHREECWARTFSVMDAIVLPTHTKREQREEC